jgi:lysophospholipase L1-like esterase
MPSSQPSRLRACLLNIAALLVGCVMALLLLEAVLHFYNPFLTRVKGNRIVLQANKQLRYTNDIIAGLEREIVVTRNSLGFRGPDPPVGFERRLTLVTIGGSTTQCFMASDDKTWTALLGEMLAKSFRDTWINNAGLDGHTTFGHTVLLEDHVGKLHPKVVLFLVGANDVAIRSATAFDSENVRDRISFSDPKALLKSVSAYSEATALALNLWRSLTAYQAGLHHSNVDMTRMSTVDVSEEEQRRRVSEGARPELLDAYSRRLNHIADLAHGFGIEPVLVTQPMLWGQGIDDMTGVDLAKVKLPGGNGETIWRILEKYNDVTRAVCEGRKLTCIDLARAMPKGRRFFYDEAHFTVEGNLRVAEIVYRGLCPMLAAEFPAYQTAPCRSIP